MKLISKETIKTCVRLFLCLILSILCGMTLLVLVNYLPSERIKNNVRSGAQIILQENAEFQYADGYVEAILDNYTDALILSKVVYPSDHPLKDAVMVPSYSFPGQDVEGMQLFGTLNDNPLDHAQIDTYARYWHGYLAVLKPFFTFFSYADFRILNQAAELILMLTIVVLMQKRHLGALIPAYAGMLILWNPGTMGVSLQYAPCCYISLGAAAFILWTSRYHAEFQKILFLFLFLRNSDSISGFSDVSDCDTWDSADFLDFNRDFSKQDPGKIGGPENRTSLHRLGRRLFGNVGWQMDSWNVAFRREYSE